HRPQPPTVASAMLSVLPDPLLRRERVSHRTLILPIVAGRRRLAGRPRVFCPVIAPNHLGGAESIAPPGGESSLRPVRLAERLRHDYPLVCPSQGADSGRA